MINRVLGIVGRHVATSRHSDEGQTGKDSGDVGSGPLKSRDRGRPIFFTESDTPHFLRDFSYKMMFSSL